MMIDTEHWKLLELTQVWGTSRAHRAEHRELGVENLHTVHMSGLQYSSSMEQREL